MAKKRSVNAVSVKKKSGTKPTAPAQLHLDGVRIVESHSKIEIFENVLPGEEFSISLRAGVGVSPSKDILIGSIELNLETARRPGDNPEVSSMSVGCTVQCLFRVTGELPSLAKENPFVGGLTNTTRVIAWPYIRQFVQSTTSNMGIPPIVLPLMHAAGMDQATPVK